MLVFVKKRISFVLGFFCFGVVNVRDTLDLLLLVLPFRWVGFIHSINL